MGVSYLLISPPTDIISVRVMRVFEIFLCVRECVFCVSVEVCELFCECGRREIDL